MNHGKRRLAKKAHESQKNGTELESVERVLSLPVSPPRSPIGNVTSSLKALHSNATDLPASWFFYLSCHFSTWSIDSRIQFCSIWQGSIKYT